MTTSGHDGEHSGAMDRIKSVWRDALGAREEHPAGGADSGQAWGGQHAPPSASPPPADSGTGPMAQPGPPRMPRPPQPAGPLPQQSAPHGLPQILPRDGEHESGPTGRPAPEATVAQAVPWQAPRPMSQPVNPQPVNQQQVNPWTLPQRSALPQPLPQRTGPQPPPQWSAPPQPHPQPVPHQPAPHQPVPFENGGRPGPQPDGSRPAFAEPVTVHVPGPIVENPAAGADQTEADPPTTLQPAVPAATDEQTVVAEPETAPEAALESEEFDEEADEQSDAADALPDEPTQGSVWTAPDLTDPRSPTSADRADTPDRPAPAHSPAPATPERTPDRVLSHLPSHITDVSAGAWTRQQNGASTRPRGRHELFDAPYPEAEPMSDPEPVKSSPPRAAADAPPANPDRFVPEERAEEYAGRWGAVKSEFVDEPRQAVRKADELVGELLDDITRALAEQRAQLDKGLDTDGTSTEDLRQAMHRYREFFDRLLIL